MNRREFIRGSAFAAAGVLTGCATGRTRAVPADDGHFIKAALIHLGSNMWCDAWTDNKPRPPASERWDFKDRVDHLRAEDAVWRECTEAMRANGFNMAVIDVGEALEYPSHPELKVKGSWSVGRMREELARLREMGLEPIPKLNFSTTHNAWMKDWRYLAATEKYDKVCAELIDDVVDAFDGPRFFHMGHDEETIGHQGGWGHYQFIVVRKGELFWKSFRANYDAVKAAGCRPWCFSDQIWYDRQRFIDNMPRDVIQCPWNCVADKNHPEYTESIDEMAKLGFDFIPDGSTYTSKREDIARTELPFVMDYCRKHVPLKQVLGFVVCPWVTTTSGVAKEKFIRSMEFARDQFVTWR